jgi:hypothetical protein
VSFFVLSRFWVFLSDWEFKAQQKLFTKKSCRAVLTKKIQNPKPILLDFFSRRGESIKNIGGDIWRCHFFGL